MTETFFTALSEIKSKALIDTLPDRPEDVEIETMDETVFQTYAEVLLKKLAYELRKVDVETLNDPVAEVKVQELLDTVRQTSTDESRRTWQHTRKG